MKLYIAAPWAYKEAARAAGRIFTRYGHEITEPWWDHRDVNGDDSAVDELLQQAWKDIAGVKSADVFVLLNLGMSEGKAVELGIALEAGVRVIAIGHRGEHSNNVFHYLPQVKWVETVTEALDWLEK